MIKHIGIDIGTENTRIYCKEKGLLICEPSVVAINANNGKVLAVGAEAKQMIGKIPEEMEILHPIKNGAVADFDVSKIMIKEFVKKALKGMYAKPSATVCMPCFSTEVEKQALLMAVSSCGLKNVRLIYTPMAVALGAELNVNDAVGSMVVSIGASVTQAAVVSMGGIVARGAETFGSQKIDEAILDYVKQNKRIILGKTTAERIKISVASVFDACEEKEITVMGRDALTGLPKEIMLTQSEIKDAITQPVNKILKIINRVIEKTPPELLSDIVKGGIVLTGAGANLSGLSQLIKTHTGINVYLPENADLCAVKGASSVKTSYFSRINSIKKQRAQLV